METNNKRAGQRGGQSWPSKGQILAPSNPPLEDKEQAWVADLCRALRLVFMHVPNESKRSVVGHVQQKRKGVVKGAPDVLIFTVPPKFPLARGVAIELKRRRARGHRHRGATDEQIEVLARMEACGWRVRVCEGLDETRAFLAELGWVS